MAAVATAAATAAAPPAAAQASRWTVEDLITEESAGQFEISPDGRWAVWVRTTVDLDKGRQRDLWLSSLSDTTQRQLTRGDDDEFAPRWSPDGRRIAFLATRRPSDSGGDVGRTQLWLLDPQGGEPWAVTALDRSIRDFAWRDSATIVVLAQERASRYERERKRLKDDAIVVEDSLHEPPVRLFAVHVRDRSVRRLTRNRDWIQRFALAPDGRRAVTVHQRSLSWEYDQRVPPHTYLVDLETGEQERLFAGTRIYPNDVQWVRDGSGFYAVADSSRHPRFLTATINVVYYHDLAAGTTRLVDLAWPRSLGRGIEVTPDGFVALLADGVVFRPARYRKRGDEWRRTDLRGFEGGNVTAWAVSRDGGRLVYAASTASTPEQWYRADLDDGQLRRVAPITRLNPSFADKLKPRTEVLRWVGALEEEVEGVLYFPLDYEAGRRYPLVLSIHGGPASVDLDAWGQGWSRPLVLLNQEGAFVLKPNYHGSGNYGLDWVESIGEGRYYDLEIPDIERGVDALIARGLVDSTRLGTMGWSNGSILSIELTTRTTRYKAASAGAGDVEWISDWANVDFGAAFDEYYFGASPLEDPELYIRKSPFFRLDRVRTPTIIYFGTEDRNVPTDQGWSHFRALQQLGHTDVRFILFPGAAHGLVKPAHQRRKMEEDLRWFRRHLFGTYEPTVAAFDSTSPLGIALRRRTFAQHDGRYGERVQGVLVPETVEHRGHRIGRFEVTRAQFAQFAPEYPVPPGTENHPASGITFEQAQGYVAWLAQRTGRAYRLGRADELRALYEPRPTGENTLDRWAGYALNPDDAAALAPLVAQLGPGAPLLEGVGSFQPVGDALVFDLGGNVAEWAVGSDGAGILLGGSADRPADPRGDYRAGEAYRGLRVVVEP